MLVCVVPSSSTTTSVWPVLIMIVVLVLPSSLMKASVLLLLCLCLLLLRGSRESKESGGRYDREAIGSTIGRTKFSSSNVHRGVC